MGTWKTIGWVKVLAGTLAIAAILPETRGNPVVAAGSECLQPIAASGLEAVVNWTTHVLTVTSQGKPKPGVTHPGVAKLTARQAAMMVAYRDALAAALQIRVNGQALVSDCAKVSKEFRNAMSTIYDSRFLPDGEQWDPANRLYSVTLAVPLTGSEGSLAKALADHAKAVEKLDRKTAKLVILPSPTPTDQLPPPTSGAITGLVIDCRGTGVKPAMNPHLLQSQGKEVWDPGMAATPDLIERGSVAYHLTLDSAVTSSRVGKNPLVIRAIGMHGRHEANVVVSVEDAGKVADANAKASPRFLDTGGVALVVN